jgi:acyl-CoA hydrolase
MAPATTLQRLMLPEHANQLGAVHGGEVMKAVDEGRAIYGVCHVRRPCATVCLDSMESHWSVRVGQRLRCNAQVSRTGRAANNVQVQVEDFIAERLRRAMPGYANAF